MSVRCHVVLQDRNALDRCGNGSVETTVVVGGCTNNDTAF